MRLWGNGLGDASTPFHYAQHDNNRWRLLIWDRFVSLAHIVMVEAPLVN